MNTPYPYGLTNLALCFIADSWKKRYKIFPMLVLCPTWPECVAKKVEALYGILFSPVFILAVHFRGLSGCSSSLHWAKRFSIVCRISFACCSVLQCTSASSAYLSNDTSGCFFLIHSSNAWCMNIFARSGLHTPPCGVPLCRFSSVPSVLCIGAFNHRSIYRRTH